MKARLCTIDDINEISKFAHIQNTKNGQRTSFMYKEEDKVKSGFKETLNNGSVQIGIFNKDKCFAYLQVITDHEFGFGDVIGPFCEVGYEELTKDLLSFAVNEANQVEVFKFNVDVNNNMQKHLVKIGAIKKEDNYQLELLAEDFKYEKLNKVNIRIISHEKRFDVLFKELYCNEFQDTYIEYNNLLNYNNNDYKLVDLLYNDDFIGFGYYRINIGYIDFLAIKSQYRGKGFGSFLLAEIIKDQIINYKISKISLNVDISNNNGIELYKKYGFAIEDHFVSYHLNRNVVI